MADDQQTLKQFLFETKSRADLILHEDHIGGDVKNVIRDLLKISYNYEDTIHQSVGHSADARVLKKKLDQSKSEFKGIEQKLAGAKTTLFKIVDEIKIVNTEAANIMKAIAADPKNPGHQSLAKIKVATQRMIEIIVQAKD